jgi:single-strand DNA-binding protein
MANFNFNKVILGGRLTADPELKTTPSGVSVTSFSIAVNKPPRNGEQQDPFFINCTAWRQTAEFITRYFRRASSICVVGSLSENRWTDKNGIARKENFVLVDEAFFVDAKSEMPGFRNNSDVIVDPNSPMLAGIDPNAAPGKAPPQAYSTPGARKEIAGEMAEDDGEQLPF